MKNEREKSDPSKVAARRANKPGQPGAEPAEPREGTEGNTGEQHTYRTPSRESVSQGLERVREAAKQRKNYCCGGPVPSQHLNPGSGTVHRAVAPCDDRSTKGCILLAQAGSGTRRGWSDMAKLQAEPGRRVSENCVCGSQSEIKDGSDQEEGARRRGPGRQEAGD